MSKDKIHWCIRRAFRIQPSANAKPANALAEGEYHCDFIEVFTL